MTLSLAFFNIHGFVLSWMEDDRMKKTTKLVREIELTQARIAALREDHARIGQEISHLVAQNKARIMELLGATVERLDLSRLPIHALLSPLSKLAEDVDHDRPNALEEANIEAFVKIGRNASSTNRRVLEMAGLHWHGRHAGWVVS
jgi:hypothetical protein